MKIIITIATVAAVLVTTVCQANQDTENTNITDWHKTRFAQLDTDSNGSLNSNELRATTKDWMSKAGYSEEKQIKQTSKKFARIDTNKDKQVSLEEFSIDLIDEKQKKANKKNKA